MAAAAPSTEARGYPSSCAVQLVSSEEGGSLGSVREIARRGPEEDDSDLVRVPNSVVAFAAVTAIGALNNLNYCVISSSVQTLAKHFHTESKVTLMPACMNFSAVLATAIHAKLMLGMRFHTRVIVALAMLAFSYIGVAMAASMEGSAGLFGFLLAGLLACVGGMAQIFGECTILAFLKTFPPELVGAWGAGTGIAGIAGGLLYIFLTGPIGLSSAAVFVLMAPTVLGYLAAFSWLYRCAVSGREGDRLEKVIGGRPRGAGDDEQPLQGHAGAAPLTLANARAAFKYSGGILLNLVAVYTLEYTIYPGLDDRETQCANKSWYPVMWASYNVGVTASRLSVAVFRIRRVWLLTLFQAVNVLGWTVEVLTGTLRNSLGLDRALPLMAGWMVLVGLCGGASYGNCMHLFNKKEGIPDDLRELGINLGLVMSNVGITSATLLFLLLDATVMSKKAIYPDGCPSH